MVSSDQKNKYLIIGPSWVGDMVMAQSLFIDIKAREPQSQIDVVAPAWTSALLNRMPEVTNLVSSTVHRGRLHLRERFTIGKELRSENYTHAIVLPNSLKSALVPAIAKIPTRTGYIGEQRWGLLNNIRKLDKQLLPMTVQRFIALGLPKEATTRTVDSIPAPQLKVNEDQVIAVVEKNQLDANGEILVLCPGAEFGASKKWPTKHYAETATFYLEKGWQVWLMGSENDIDSCEKINKLSGEKCHVLAGKTTLPEAIDLISCASLVVSNDSGLMHIAAALQRPLIAVYGSTDPGHTPPLSANHKVARLNLSCSPCFKRECPLGHLECLTKLLPERVIQLCEELLLSERQINGELKGEL